MIHRLTGPCRAGPVPVLACRWWAAQPGGGWPAPGAARGTRRGRRRTRRRAGRRPPRRARHGLAEVVAVREMTRRHPDDDQNGYGTVTRAVSRRSRIPTQGRRSLLRGGIVAPGAQGAQRRRRNAGLAHPAAVTGRDGSRPHGHRRPAGHAGARPRILGDHHAVQQRVRAVGIGPLEQHPYVVTHQPGVQRLQSAEIGNGYVIRHYMVTTSIVPLRRFPVAPRKPRPMENPPKSHRFRDGISPVSRENSLITAAGGFGGGPEAIRHPVSLPDCRSYAQRRRAEAARPPRPGDAPAARRHPLGADAAGAEPGSVTSERGRASQERHSSA
ncbi:hypothetical protein FHX40_4437 [Thermopolyspora flexuosa]|uniref:Uncharacterized protein n=1 Tax=Thermopolyspora flexuosa TaxID=103836 RepID=A0A543J4A6_9ACTN|nr:hypothetical protein FHX40_4437 [Thermopolyspora flexuosa]